jgi:2-C-methyl-D-erythritol 4-phosphate cytidylyltransferase / 2-C-methyl-D-erythritol 2,4-cyclodiphosphate synthase
VPVKSQSAVLIVAAGRGLRAGGSIPKQYQRLAGRMVLTRTIEMLAKALPAAPIVCITHPDDQQLYHEAIAEIQVPGVNLIAPVAGDATRQTSVRNGLKALMQYKNDTNIVLIHDSVRLFCSNTLIHRLVVQAMASGAAIPGYRIPDALKYVSGAGIVTGQANRENLFAVQTPQVFHLDLIHDAHCRTAAAGISDLPDDAAVAEWAGHPVTIVESDASNIKLTTPADFGLAEHRLMNTLPDVRIGQGFDVHAFAEGNGVWLGGISIPHNKRLSGHSDADVGLHALTDAILGAIADGDIGSHFPPSDPQWKGASSDRFLRYAVERVALLGGEISHLDLTIIAEEPKIGPHRDAMRAAIAAIAGLETGRVAVKATTTEQLGFTGRKEGIAAQAVATVRLPLGSLAAEGSSHDRP